MGYRITNNWYEEAYFITMAMSLLFEHEFPKWFGESIWFTAISVWFSVIAFTFSVICFVLIWADDKYFKRTK